MATAIDIAAMSESEIEHVTRSSMHHFKNADATDSTSSRFCEVCGGYLTGPLHYRAEEQGGSLRNQIGDFAESLQRVER